MSESSSHHIPLIRLFDNLIVSVQVALSDDTIERLTGQVTEAIERTKVSGLILDFSGADVMDSHITRRVRDLAVTAGIMGVRTVVCGLRASVVVTLVEMGLTIPGVRTALNLERALELLVVSDPSTFYQQEDISARERESSEERGSSGAGG